jgi:hypothetical protein
MKTHLSNHDIYGINSYSCALNLADRAKNTKYKFDKPYLVTEFGPLRSFEVSKAF